MDPADAQAQFEDLYALLQAGDDEFDQKFLERYAISVDPERLRLCEQHCYEKFDRHAELAFPLLAILPVLEFNQEFEQDLTIAREGLLTCLRQQLGEPLSAERREIYRRAAAILGAKRLGWLARAKRAGATRPRHMTLGPAGPTGADDGFAKANDAGPEMIMAQPAGVQSPKAEPCEIGSEWGWESIEITFLSELKVQITTPEGTYPQNYAEMGFADGRAKGMSNKPKSAWLVLRALAKLNGVIPDGSKMSAEWTEIERRIQEIRKGLRKHFRTPGDPIPYVRGTGYRASFKVRCASAYDV